MGWDYEERIMYGFYTTNIDLTSFLNKNPVLMIDSQLSNDSEIFIYIKSTYEVLDEDYGTYAYRMPDDCPCFTKVVNNKAPHILTEVEQESLDDFCFTYNKFIELVWINNAYISY